MNSPPRNHLLRTTVEEMGLGKCEEEAAEEQRMKGKALRMPQRSQKNREEEES